MPGAFRYTLIDVFTDTPLAGNQLAVFTDARAIPEALLQPLAREMSFSETVFVLPPTADGNARIRIFTPAREIPFAGHPTLGTALVLAAGVGLAELRIETGSGTIPVRIEREGPRPVAGFMSQPVPTVAAYGDCVPLFAALGIERSELPVEIYDNGLRHVFIALASPAAVTALEPDLAALRRLGPLGINCFAPAGARWKTRMFDPAMGVNEDPATGSAAGPLALHLARHGRARFGEQIEIAQGEELGRPSRLLAKVEGTADKVERVEVGGAGVVVARGEFRLRG
jgi:trans-2,3-dihydro-3-hydroxyanthranilate isomerase